MNPAPALLQAVPIVMRLDLHPGQVVGDFGVGGSAHVATELAQGVGSSGTVILFDVQKNALASAVSNLQLRGCHNIQSVWTDLEIYQAAQGIPDGSIDSGVMINILHHSQHPKAMLTEVGRMLHSGGRLVIVDWLTDQTTPLAPPQKMRLGAEHVAQIAAGADLRKVEDFSAGPYHWGIVLEKT